MRKEVFGIKAPEKECNDRNCPFHGTISVRGRIFVGTVKSAKARRTAVVIREFKKLIPKYERTTRKISKFYAHNPDCISAEEGDKVIIAETRPISKTKHFVILGVKK
ncbi:MAG: 30S ribosomal protein S17 [Candidatus Woesearchaeota archaeon]